MPKSIKHFIHDDAGASLVEYAILIALAVVIIIPAMTAMGGALDGFLDGITEALDPSGNSNTANGGTNNPAQPGSTPDPFRQ